MTMIDWFKPDPCRFQPFEIWARQHFPNRSTDIATIVLMILVEQLSVELSDLTPTARLVADLKADDLDPVELLLAIEQEFCFKIPREDAENFMTIDDLMLYVEQRRVLPSVAT